MSSQVWIDNLVLMVLFEHLTLAFPDMILRKGAVALRRVTVCPWEVVGTLEQSAWPPALLGILDSSLFSTYQREMQLF